VIYPSRLQNDISVIVIDTGYPGQLPQLKQALAEVNISLNQITQVLLTHQDIDHIGNLPELIKHFPSIEVLSPLMEKPYIQGEKQLQKLSPEAISTALQSIPANVPEQWKKAFEHTLENPPKAKVDLVVKEGDRIGDMIVIDTPGHTIGHISLYHGDSKALIAGDALIAEGNNLYLSPPDGTYDIKQAISSVKKLTAYDIETVICYHGGVVRGNIKKRLLELTQG
jgi:glyoxylase-like metal-dependent hydrolase (beta-lactamase superfamily II)